MLRRDYANVFPKATFVKFDQLQVIGKNFSTAIGEPLEGE